MPSMVKPLPSKAPLAAPATRLPACEALPGVLLRPPASLTSSLPAPLFSSLPPLSSSLLPPPFSSPPPPELSAPPPPSLCPPPPSFPTPLVPLPPLPPAPSPLPLAFSRLRSGRPGRRSGPVSFRRRSLRSACCCSGVGWFSGCLAYGGFTCGFSVTSPRFIPQVCARTIHHYHVFRS